MKTLINKPTIRRKSRSKKYRKFGIGTDGVVNDTVQTQQPSVEDLQKNFGNIRNLQIAPAKLNADDQAFVDDLKSKVRPFMVDDFYYRLSKSHPEAQKEQIANVYDNQSVRPLPYYDEYPETSNTQAMYVAPFIPKTKDEAYMLARHQNRYTSNGVEPIRYAVPNIVYNKFDPMDTQTLAHEMGHAYDDQLQWKLTDDENRRLAEAYPDEIFNAGIDGTSAADERRSTNRELRKAISEKYGGVIGKDLDDAIIKMPAKEKYELYKNINGYAKDGDYYKISEGRQYDDFIKDRANLDKLNEYDKYLNQERWAKEAVDYWENHRNAAEYRYGSKRAAKDTYKWGKNLLKERSAEGYVDPYSKEIKDMYKLHIMDPKERNKKKLDEEKVNKLFNDALINIAYNTPQRTLNIPNIYRA